MRKRKKNDVRVNPVVASDLKLTSQALCYLQQTHSEFCITVEKANRLGEEANGVLAGPVLPVLSQSDGDASR